MMSVFSVSSRHRVSLVIGAWSLIILLTESAAAESPIDIGSRQELFVDDYLIESLVVCNRGLISPQFLARLAQFSHHGRSENSRFSKRLQMRRSPTMQRCLICHCEKTK